MKKIVLGTIGITSAVVIGGTVIPSVIKNKNETVSMEQEIDEIVPAVTPEIINIPLENEDVNDDEYIFPNSDTELLTDQDLENLSAEVLALARNEIIARHGRIFTKEIYKNYFESKSWYSGTIAPEVFDTNYDNELNEIEKANIILIERYENSIKNRNEKEIIDYYYGEYLEKYRNYEARGFRTPDETFNTVYLDSRFFGDGFDSDLYYALVDLANDGIPELLIGADDNVYEFCGVNDSGEVCPLINTGDFYLGTQFFIDICRNNMINLEMKITGYYSGVSYAYMEPNSIHQNYVEAVYREGDDYYTATLESEYDSFTKGAPITYEEYKSMIGKYPLKEDINWHKLSEYKISTIDTNLDATIESGKVIYEWVLTYYRKYIKDGCQMKLEYINGIHNEYPPDLEDVFYAFADMSGDGTPELFIAHNGVIVDIYSYVPEQWYEENEYVAWNSFSKLGETTKCTICDNVLKVESIEGFDKKVICYYSLDTNSSEYTCIEAVKQDGDSYYLGYCDEYDVSFTYEETITIEEFEKVQDKYLENTSVTWFPLVDW